MATSTVERVPSAVDDGADTRSWPAQPLALAASDDWQQVQALRRGDAAAFEALLNRYHHSMVRRARSYVGNPEVAEEVVQETWIAVLRGIDRFEGRSALKTWLFNILANRARTCAVREARGVRWGAPGELPSHAAEPTGATDSFGGTTPFESATAGHGDQTPEGALLAREIRGCIQDAVAALPASQRDVLTLRDIEGWSADEVCSALAVTCGNQRVLLHRARSRVRRALEPYLDGGE